MKYVKLYEYIPSGMKWGSQAPLSQALDPEHLNMLLLSGEKTFDEKTVLRSECCGFVHALIILKVEEGPAFWLHS